MGTVMTHRGKINDLNPPGVPIYNSFGLMHIEEHVELISPVRVGSTVHVKEELVDMVDKKKGYIFITQTTIVNKQTGEEHYKIKSKVYNRAPGGFGKIKEDNPIQFYNPPKRKPDF